MLDICYDEMEMLKEYIEKDTFIGVQFLDTWDYEDDYSHNHIEENREAFLDMANEYFQENNLPYIMREVCENAMVCDTNGNVLRN